MAQSKAKKLSCQKKRGRNEKQTLFVTKIDSMLTWCNITSTQRYHTSGLLEQIANQTTDQGKIPPELKSGRSHHATHKHLCCDL